MTDRAKRLSLIGTDDPRWPDQWGSFRPINDGLQNSRNV